VGVAFPPFGKDAGGPCVRLLGILERYIIDQIARSFALAVVALTAVIVLFMIMAEAQREGLQPGDVARVIIFIIPGTLVYTVPVALLFAVSVVYGRLASDNEIVAMKAAGLSAWKALNPSLILGLAISLIACLSSGEVIPRSNYYFKSAIFKNMEDTFYMFLKREREFNNPRWPFFIGVKDVKDRLLIGATFKHRKAGSQNPNTFDFTVQAKTAVIHFNTKKGVVQVMLDDADVQGQNQYSHIPHKVIEYDLPPGAMMDYKKKIQEMTAREVTRELADLDRKIRQERQRQAIAAALWIASGRIERVDWPHIGQAYREHAYWQRQKAELLTETHMRVAMATGSLFFVLLGAPVGILFARRDFLSAFMTCFLPIIVIYYPLVLMGVNMGREEAMPPYIVWSGNVFLGLLAGFVALPRVTRY
jgi:lipopolysaccharide export system permease protein